MQNWRELVVSSTDSVIATIATIDRIGSRFVLVVAEGGRLLGTVTDGDIRRGILRGVPVSAAVTEVMNPHAETISVSADVGEARALMRSRQISHVPAVDTQGRVVAVYSLEELTSGPRRDNCVVLMAGGRGQRLQPLTQSCPKPMLKVGGRPILETILQSFIEAGFHRFFISVNYMADVIKDHFGDGSNWGCSIRYLEETEQLGTAGALQLLPERPTLPFFVMNGDILTKANFLSLLDFHEGLGALATMCVREYSMEVPFGVVHVDGEIITQLTEKPVHSMFVNAGLYLLDPACLDRIPRQSGLYNMTDLFGGLIEERKTVASFPLHEYWLDIGRMSDFERAHHEFITHFA